MEEGDLMSIERKLDGAAVLFISERGAYYRIATLGESSDAGILICYFDICKYDDSEKIFLFSCDADMVVQGDSDFDTIDEAKACATRWAGADIMWS